MTSISYGKACIQCRHKKRKCQPLKEGQCVQCEKDAEFCQFSQGRKRVTVRASSSSRTRDSSSPRRSTTHYPTSPFDAPTTSTMSVGHGTTFLTAMREAADRVCGDALQLDEQLLQTYFVWQAPQHMPIDEEAFRRDMPNGPYFSPALLYAIQAQASRHSLQNDGWKYADMATALILTSISSPPTIPTIQALLILAGRDLALGQSSSGWLKSGMAFRLISDMNIDLWSKDHSEDARMRRRLWWSAYSWDKFFALTLGRQPTLHLPTLNGLTATPELVRPSPRPIWEPFPADDRLYAPQPAYEAETFYSTVLLYQIVESIIHHVYPLDRFARAAVGESVIASLSSRLLAWRSHASPVVILDTAYLPPISPPPHVLSLNILYRTAWILLCRPMPGRDSQSAQQMCTAKSAEIHLLFKLHDRCFGLRNITYLLAYMAYVSATVDVAEARSGDAFRASTATSRLELTFRVLTRAAQHTPGIQSSIQHLRQRLAPTRSLPSGMATPTTGHPSSDIRPEQISEALTQSAFDGPTLDELIASLSSEGYTNQPLNMEESTAFLPFWDFDWFDNNNA